MAYSEFLADRIREKLSQREDVEEKAMFGGLAFMVDGKMCLGAMREKGMGEDRMMARLAPENTEEYLEKDGCQPMDFTGKRMKGFFYIQGEGLDSDEQLSYWVGEALAFNPLAKKSRK